MSTPPARAVLRHALRASLLVAIAAGATLPAVDRAPAQDAPPVAPDRFDAMQYRSVGPHRGGRVTAVEGIRGKPTTFFMGASGGGVWKTESAGLRWTNVTDGFLSVGSIGAIEVAEADPNVIYVGTGSADLRGNVSTGRGVYRSTDGGESWDFLGLEETGSIARIHTHPEDPDRVWLAAVGHPFGPNEQRGVYRSTDGGESWENVLFVSDSVGAVDLAMNPENPRVMYAAMWRGERKPWTMISGGRTGGVYRTTDGGDSWEKLTNGLPSDGLVGKIGVTVSPVDPDRVWALVEAPEGEAGLYRSDDGGDSWRLINDERDIRSRPWYYMHIYAHPTDRNTVWIAGGDLWKSVDGGRSFESIPMPHGDQHDLWINPDRPEVMVEGNDGGATVTQDGGETWSPQFNQPTAEFYSVEVDDQFPYRIYGPQQDNSTISIPNHATDYGISVQHWKAHGGCETGPIAIRPDDPSVTYAGCYGGRMVRADLDTEQIRQIRPYPQQQDGMPERELRYRFQWNAPISLSPHDPDILYRGSQYVHVSRNEGQSWEVVSPDLTRADSSKFGMAGGPITHDVTGVEIYSALLVLEESPHRRGVIWTGSNDGLVHVTRDTGRTWTDVTPPSLPNPSTVNRIDISPHRPGKAYVTAYRYRLDDWTPYVYRTTDYGESWTRIADGTRGIPDDYTTRVVREDPEREGLLYAGTEFGAFVSFDDGGSWQPLQLNLPRTPVTDLKVKRGDLVVATQGRSFWVLDDVTPLREIAAGSVEEDVHLYAPRPAYRTSAQDEPGHYERDHINGLMSPASWKGQNPPHGAILYYHLEAPAEDVTIEILEEDGDRVRALEDVPAGAGSHRVVWDLRYEAPVDMRGPRAVPGTYRVRLTADGATRERTVEVRKDPRLTDVSRADLQAQFDYLTRAQQRLAELEEGLSAIEDVRGQLDALMERTRDEPWSDSARARADELRAGLAEVESALIQTEPGYWSAPPQVRANLRWAFTAASSQRGVLLDQRPTDQLVERLGDLETQLEDALDRLDGILGEDVPALNDYLVEQGVQPLSAPSLERGG